MKELRSSLDPFPFAVIDDIMDPYTFGLVKEYGYHVLNRYEEKGIHQHIMDKNESPLLFSVLEGVNDEFRDIYYDKWGIDKNITSHTNVQFSCYNTDHTDYPEYNIHNDSKKKITSCVIALSDRGNMTEIYSGKKKLVHSPEWKPNRGVLFKRSDTSWHKVGNPLGGPRLCVNIFRSGA